MTRLGCTLAATLALVPLLGTEAPAQYFRFGGGSTVQGDILRGMGSELIGEGYYNFNTALANSINVNTSIRLNEYVWAVAKQQNKENAEHRAQKIARNKEIYEKIRQRIRNSPEEKDVLKGDSLNAEMEKLLDPAISPSNFRLAKVQLSDEVPLSGDIVRRIPFFFGKEGATFSMQRLTAKGKWPVGLRDERLAVARRGYERAVDAALDQQLEGGKLSRDAILKVEAAVAELRDALDRVVLPSKDKVYVEARQHLDRLAAMSELFKRKDIEVILGEIDRYPGATVHDLIVFMQKYNLRFGVPELGDERALFPQLYAAFVQQREQVGIPRAEPGR